MLNLQNQINNYMFLKNSEKIFITVSIGISYLNEENESLSGLSKAADIALYKVKNNGRNKVEIQKKINNVKAFIY